MLEAVALQQRLNHANVHRGVHLLSERSTAAFEGARDKVRRFINAASPARKSCSRAARRRPSTSSPRRSAGRALEPGDEVLITWMEHHSNIVPWQLICEQTGARLRVAPITTTASSTSTRSGVCSARARRSSPHARVERARHREPRRRAGRGGARAGAVVLVDGAQAVPHMRVDVRALDCDFYAFSGPQDVRPDGHRRAVRQARAARRHAALPRRRRHDPDGQLRAQHVQRPALQVRGRHAEHHGRRRARRGGRLSRAHRLRRPLAAHEHALLDTRRGGSSTRFRARG